MEGNDRREKLSSILEQRSPLGNTVLHMAARYGNNEAAEHITRQDHKLLKAQNSDGDTALHVAARAGNISTLQKLLATYFHEESTKYCSRSGQNFIQTTVSKNILEDMLSLVLSTNKEGNTFFHEALINSNKQSGIFRDLDKARFVTNIENLCTVEADFKLAAKQVAASITNNEEKTALYLAVEAGSKKDVNQLLDHCLGVPLHGKSPLLGAIMKRDLNMLKLILRKKPEWRHLRDADGRTPLHYAAATGYIDGVDYLLRNCCPSCAIESDRFGFYPLHLASDGGHVPVIEMLLEYSLDLAEIVDKRGRNILHIAAESGKLNVVKYILQSPKVGNMIKQKDANGNTPLHLASVRSHPRIVHYLTWDKRVDLTLLNKSNQTPLDAMEISVGENPPLSQRLTWSALKSATPKSSVKSTEKKAANPEQFKDRTDTLIVVSTLIITATFAAGFTLPGGNSSSDSDADIANMINHSMFHLFIFSVTVSMYGAIGATVILIWSRLRDLTLMLAAGI